MSTIEILTPISHVSCYTKSPGGSPIYLDLKCKVVGLNVETQEYIQNFTLLVMGCHFTLTFNFRFYITQLMQMTKY